MLFITAFNGRNEKYTAYVTFIYCEIVLIFEKTERGHLRKDCKNSPALE